MMLVMFPECISTQGKLEKYAWSRWESNLPWPGIFFKFARCGYTLRVTSQALVCISFISGEKVLIEVNSTSTGDQVAAKILKEK